MSKDSRLMVALSSAEENHWERARMVGHKDLTLPEFVRMVMNERAITVLSTDYQKVYIDFETYKNNLRARVRKPYGRVIRPEYRKSHE